jgi:RHS repeat-associated protein
MVVMKLFKFLIFLFVSQAIIAQTTTQNYVVTTIPFQSVSDAASLTDVNSNTTIQYIDGLGRLSQAVQKAITPNSADLISVSIYSVFGRDSLQWLPAVVASNNGAYYSNYTNYCNQSISSNGGDTKPYLRTEFESSPLNRVTGQYSPGIDWYNNSKKVSTTYTFNGTDVKYFYVENDLLKCNGTYSGNTLNGVQTTDEDGKTIVEYTDKIGRKILKRVAGNYDTYYVYDDIGNLRYVLPPLAADGLSTNTTGFSESAGSVLYLFAYIYHYDGRKRLVEKKLPGTSWTYMVYDMADRLILSSDGNQYIKNNHQWTVSKYDKFGRLLYTGLLRINSDRSSYSLSVTNDSYTGAVSTGGYSSLILTPSRLLTVNYYDNYTYRTGLSTYSSIQAILGSVTQSGYPTPDLTHIKPQTTGVCIYHLDDSTKFELNAIYYDKYGRVVQSRSSNHLAGYDLTYNLVDFTGKPTKTYKTHGISGASTTITEEYSYTFDKAQRILTTTHKLNGGTSVTLSTNTYDELGRLNSKAISGSLVSTSYTYNVRGWLTGLTSPKFTENLYYYTNSVSLPSFTASYNGNISGMKWSIPEDNLGYDRAYSFTYDALDRLTTGNYCGKSGTSTYTGTTGKFDEIVTYDKMGNILTLNRKEDGTGLNYLTYNYTGNQLLSVDNSLSPVIPYGSEAFVDRAELSTEYAYDKNGNTVYDANRGISTVRFNLLNLPEIVQFTVGHQNRYVYGAGGKKLSATSYTLNTAITVPQGTISQLPSNPADYVKVVNDYIGNIIYQNSSLKQIQTSEGYCQGGVYFYYLKDHLGNTRYVINSSGTKIETSHYYPFGMRFYIGSTTNSVAIGFRYNGKELDVMNGLNNYDYGARFYDPQIGRWNTIDPLANKYYSLSPYCYVADNPIKLIDPDGMDWILSTGNKVYWYGGNVGDMKNLIVTYKATSGNNNAKDIHGKVWNLQQAKYQNVKNGGPTPEGKYSINLTPDPSRVAEADLKTGSLIPNPKGGIEKIPGFVKNPDKPGWGWTYQEWGENRAKLDPDKNTDLQGRDNSFYLHDSAKGYTHGCTETETSLFDNLNSYRDEGNKKIDVVIKYPSPDHKTNGGTKKNEDEKMP